MKEDNKTKKQLIHELTELRSQNAELKKSITESISAEAAAEEASSYAESIVETVREPLLVLDADLKIISANRNFYRTFKVTPGETISSFIYDLGNKQWDIPKLRDLLEEVLPEKQAFEDFEVDHNFEDIGHKIMLLNARQIHRKYIGAKIILLAIEDITERKEIEAGLEKTRKELAVVKIAADEVSEYAESVINTVREPLIVLDHDLRIVTASRSFYNFFKVKPEETVGQLIYNLGNKQWDIPKLRELLESILPEKTTFESYEVEHDFATIGKRTMLLNARQIKRIFGKERIILLAIEDITERKQLEDLLTESEERYRRLFETASDGIVLLEKSEGKITHANPATEKMLGYTSKDSIGNSLTDIGISLDMGNFKTTLQNLNRSGILNFDDISITTKSGQHIDTDIYLVDRARLVQCNIRDITERKQAGVDLKESKELMEAVVENIPLMIFLKEAKDLRFVIFNRAGEELLGYDRKALLGKSNLNLFPPEQAAHFMAKDREVLDGEFGILDIPEEPILTAKKGTRLLHTKKVCIRGTDGKTKYLLGISDDITERKRGEEELRQTLDSLRRAVNTTIQVMVSTLEARDPYTAGHQLRATDIARAIATEMGLSQDVIEGIQVAGSIHDIGKISIPAEILSKPSKLSEIEFSLIKEHAHRGFEILKDVESPWPLAEIVYQHHERMDGSGYPRKLKGEEILIEARILSVADVVEAMASHRPYRAGLGIDAALEEISKNRNIFYDPEVVDTCLKIFNEKSYKLLN
jgi:PAS domain S-box-containing protein